MRVTVDQHKCVSSGQSVLAAENVFDQREDDGVVVVVEQQPTGRAAGRRTGGGRDVPSAGAAHHGRGVTN
jgi:ferredoxin